MNGACKFCGQIHMTNAETEEAAATEATMRCRCAYAVAAQIAAEKEEDDKSEIQNLYGGAVPQEVIGLICQGVEQMTNGNVSKVQYQLTNGRKLIVARKGINFTIEINKATKQKVEV